MYALLDKYFFGSKDCSLCIQRIEDRFNQNDIGAAVHQSANLISIGDTQIIEGDCTIARIVHVRRKRGGTVCRSECACNKAAATVFLLSAQGCTSGKARAIAVQFVNRILHAVIGLSNGG